MKILILFFSIFYFNFYHAQYLKIEGCIEQTKNERVIASIAVNDTINKLEKLDSTNFSRRKKVNAEKKVTTISDENGKFEIYAKITDTLYFRFGRLFDTEKHAVSKLLQNEKILITPNPIPCITEKICDQKLPTKIYAFIGRKIDVTYVDTSKYCDLLMDSKYKAIYEVKKQFGDKYHQKEIQFTAYDHYSLYKYQFQNYDNILVFVGEKCGDLIHLKYQFYPLYKTANGKWATLIDTRMDYFKKIEPSKINFDKSLWFEVPDLSPEQIEYRFPKKYYRIENKKAYPIMGIYAKDLAKFKLQRIKEQQY